MAHDLNENNGKTSFASTKPAWHGLGQIVEKAMTSEEAIKLAGLDYDVVKVPLYGKDVDEHGKEDMLPVPKRYATMRADNKAMLGVVSDSYHIVQNVEAFAFFDDIVGGKQAIFETAGALGLGQKTFITAKMPEQIRIEGTDDMTEVYLLLANSHDGSASITATVTPVRVVCANTLAMALQGAKRKVSITHTKKANELLKEADKLLGISHKYIEECNQLFNHLAKKPIVDEQVKKLLEELFKSEKEDSKQILNLREQVWKSYQIGTGQDKILGTAWGVYNGITHYLDHEKKYRTQSSKFTSIMEGASLKLANQALEMLVSM